MLPNNPIRWLTVAVGLFWLFFGVQYLLAGEGDKVGQGLVILFPLGIAFLALGLAKPSDPGSVEGVEARDGGTVFHPVPARRMTSVIALAGFLCLGVGMILFPGDSPDTDQGAVRGIGAVIALVFAALVFLSLRGIRRGHMTVTLTPAGLHQRNRLRDQALDWEEIDEVGAQQWRGTHWTVLRRDGADVMVPHQFMAADPQVFHALVEHLHAHPEDRPLLADPGGEALLRRLGLGAAQAADGPHA